MRLVLDAFSFDNGDDYDFSRDFRIDSNMQIFRQYFQNFVVPAMDFCEQCGIYCILDLHYISPFSGETMQKNLRPIWQYMVTHPKVRNKSGVEILSLAVLMTKSISSQTCCFGLATFRFGVIATPRKTTRRVALPASDSYKNPSEPRISSGACPSPDRVIPTQRQRTAKSTAADPRQRLAKRRVTMTSNLNNG
jgi:hypothetical protein